MTREGVGQEREIPATISRMDGARTMALSKEGLQRVVEVFGSDSFITRLARDNPALLLQMLRGLQRTVEKVAFCNRSVSEDDVTAAGSDATELTRALVALLQSSEQLAELIADLGKDPGGDPQEGQYGLGVMRQLVASQLS